MTTDQKAYLYRVAKAAKTGQEVQCPTCAKPFVKASYQQAFCSNRGPGNCKDAYWQTMRGADPRSPQDYAIEHAGYLADAADHLQDTYKAYGAAQHALEEASEGEDLDALTDAMGAARTDLHEALGALQGCTHEFRKRADRAKEPGQ